MKPKAGRRLTQAEKSLLNPIFGNMLPYSDIVCRENTDNIGGSANSITPKGTPYFSTTLYALDFAKSIIDHKWVFVHEMAHVWQYYHGQNVILEALVAFAAKTGNYGDAYPYTLAPTSAFGDFNLEQQASIVADYWILTQSGIPKYNTTVGASLGDYASTMQDFKAGGPPHRPSLNDYPL